MALVTVKNLSFRYPEADEAALHDLSLEIGEGEFVLLCGASGCGKTTLLRSLKPSLAPHGEQTGSVFYDGIPLAELEERRAAGEIGYLLQNPENQIVTDMVWHELAFGLENLGLPPEQIRLRTAEMASYFGLLPLYHRQTADLSGGQKQLLNLAAVMAMRPRLLILDEPTSQLDPIAAGQFLETARRLNRDTGVTILLAEHRLEEAFSMADRVLLMEKGRIICNAPPRALAAELHAKGADELLQSLPTAARIYYALGGGADCPMTVREGRSYLQTLLPAQTLAAAEEKTEKQPTAKKETALRLKRVFFRYERETPDVLRDLELTVSRGELLTIVGANGSGKSTLLSLLAGLRQPTAGKLLVDGKGRTEKKALRERVGLLPQNPQTLFVKDTLEADLREMLPRLACGREEGERRLAETIKLLSLKKLLSRHPYDLSGGEQQKAALAKLLLRDPAILLLDEPTKGLDPYARQTLGQLLARLAGQGRAVVAVTHDIEWSALFADRCALLFDGQLAAEGEPRHFYAQNSYYTTAAARMTQGLLCNAVTDEDVIEQCRKNRG